MNKDLKTEMIRLGRMYDEQIAALWDAVVDGQIEVNRLLNERNKR